MRIKMAHWPGPLIFAATLLAGCTAPQPPASDPFRATGELIALSGGNGGSARACIACHGLHGEGDGGGSPRLAGLDRGYLHRQLADFASGRRQHAIMRDVAQRLDDSDRARVSAYYANLPVPAYPAIAPDITGARLYMHGDPARGIQPCAACHGMAGEGAGAANPPLAGQPTPYLEAQMVDWREGRRRNDPGGVMLDISRRLTPRERRAVARHAAGLAASPQPAATFLPERHAHPGNGASAPPPHAERSPPPTG